MAKAGAYTGLLVCLLLSSGSGATIARQTESPPADRLELQSIGANRWQLNSGSRLNIYLATPVTSETARFGDEVKAILDCDIYAGKTCLARKGAPISGIVAGVARPRNNLKAKFADHHWLNADAGIQLKFESLKLTNGARLNIDARPSANTEVVRAVDTADPLIVDRNGEIMPQRRGKIDRVTGVGVTAAGFLTPPLTGILISGAAGAVRPTYSLGAGGALRSKHRRIKGFCLGAVDGIPGVGVARLLLGRGQNIIIDTGDRLSISFNGNLTIENSAQHHLRSASYL